ncbi:aspartate aminotransferase family protein (plasmid) [Cytobacillus spongiae]|uniref:aspartate aminotransferase family protein n=1 Tax=Cytobacillus spongiae TaxID=2901381 RepID=UPI00145E9546|nr:aspartate aminotransferase family protein [Cytobacillus spongiae]MCA1063071.1 aspartate aminotransferase family protein [Rossellomorea aquimaris]NMH70403.1 aspartate aminotransferase family protein [Bacillus sp. RO3]UII58660.1 aspartate aminotransferase family protein [Cytobacillus spongiae]
MPHSHLIKPLIGEHYPTIDYGKGVYLYDTDGREYIDACSGAVTANVGHGMEEILQSIVSQGNKVAFVYRSQFSNQPAEDLATFLHEKTGYPWSFFVNSGSEAVETAIKIAIQHWQEQGRPMKRKILSRWLSYHGITFGALSASGHPARRERFDSYLGDWPTIEPPYCSHCPFGKTYPSCNLVCASQLETMIMRIGADNIAAFMAEPIIGAAGGAITPPRGYYERIKSICEEHEILFISDEVMTGCGRTGTFLALDQWGVKADIVAIGKGLSAGYAPIAATLIADNIMEPIENGSKMIMSGHTFSGNPMSATAALAVLKLIDSEKMIEGVHSKGTYLKNLIEKLKTEFSFIQDVRGRGLLLGIEFTSLGAAFTSSVVQAGVESGILLYPAAAGIDGRKGSAIMVAPPLNSSKRELEEMVKRLRRTFQLVLENGKEN